NATMVGRFAAAALTKTASASMGAAASQTTVLSTGRPRRCLKRPPSRKSRNSCARLSDARQLPKKKIGTERPTSNANKSQGGHALAARAAPRSASRAPHDRTRKAAHRGSRTVSGTASPAPAEASSPGASAVILVAPSQPRGDVLPVHQLVEEVREIGGALVAEVDVVGMFPHVAAEKRSLAEAERVHAVLGLGDLEATVLVLHEPGPAGTELPRTGGGEVVLELLDRTKRPGDRLFQGTRHLLVLARPHHLPELVVVPVLAGVVEDARLRHGARLIGAADDVLEALALPLGPGDELVAVVDIGLVMEIMMVFERFLRHAEPGEGIVGI